MSSLPVLRSATTKAVAGVAAYEGAQKLYESSKQFWKQQFAYTVTMSEKDFLYAEVHNWLMTVLPSDKHRSLLVSSNQSAYGDPVSDEFEEEVIQPLTVRHNDSATRTVLVDGHKVAIQILSPEIKENSGFTREIPPARIQFTTKTHVAQQAVIKHLMQLNDQRKTTRKAVLRMVNQWGSWRTRSDLPPRTMASVSLPREQKFQIINDMDQFLKAEEQYNKLAISWHRGYMFHGPPGTGKTSLVKALANHFNLDLWYISLADLKAESSLLGLLAEVSPRSILLLEDIDTMRITHDRDGAEQGTISMSSLLNTLDGVATPHGLITVMTTNRFEVLDDALTRAGRMDLIEELSWPSANTLSDMFWHFYGRAPWWRVSTTDDEPLIGLSTAQIAEVFKQHMNDPESAELEVMKLIASKV